MLALASCTGSGGSAGDGTPAPTPASSIPPSTTSTPGPTTTGTATTATTTPSFAADVTPVDAARLHASWRPGCPVGPDDLRLVVLSHWGFDGAVHTGELVVHADVVDDVVTAMRAIFDAGFPIERMELVDVYGGDDDASMRANNTSAFNCRPVTGGSRWSQHAYGRAIDINPLRNPYVDRGGSVLDPASARYTDRSLGEPGMIRDGDAIVVAFAAIGWGWGGHFHSIKDYQHFSATGR